MTTNVDRDGLSPAPGQPGPAGSSDAPSQLDAAAASVVHDLCNALTVVLGSLEQLRRRPPDARGRQQLDRAEWGARHAGRLARTLLTAAPDDAAEVVDLNAAVRAFAVTMGQSLDGGARLTVELAPGPLPARLSTAELERALLNLVRNATDATANGGQVTIRTAGHRMDGLGDQPTVEVAVSDTGAGMSPEAARHATEAFFTTKKQGRGTGLGLWVAQRFAEDGGGKVEVETAPGQGTTVRLVLPRAETE